MKNKFIILLGIMASFLVFNCTSYAQETNQKITYHYLANDTLVIEGEGVVPSVEMGYYEEDKFTTVKKIVIKEGVTGLGDYCFARYYPKVISIELPSTLQTIGTGAFMECVSLKKIVIPKGIDIIPKESFKKCENLESVTLANTVTAIKKDAFWGCQSLKKLVIPQNVSIWEDSIKKCPSLKKIVNFSSKELSLDDCRGNKIWYVNGKKVKNVKPKTTAVSKGKKYKISYDLVGGKKTGKLPQSYAYGTSIKLPLNAVKKGYVLLGWYNPSDSNMYYATHTSQTLSGNIKLTPFWVKYKVKNIRKKSIQILIDDKDAVVPFGYFYVRYSVNKDMTNAKYCSRYGNSSTKRVIRKLKKNKKYYVQISYGEYEDEEWGNTWVGKRSVWIRR